MRKSAEILWPALCSAQYWMSQPSFVWIVRFPDTDNRRVLLSNEKR